MSRIVPLDNRPLGLLTNPKSTDQTEQCVGCLRRLLAAGQKVVVPEITDYELRRELLRAEKTAGLVKLDDLKITLGYVPLTTAAMQQAAEF